MLRPMGSNQGKEQGHKIDSDIFSDVYIACQAAVSVAGSGLARTHQTTEGKCVTGNMES